MDRKGMERTFHQRFTLGAKSGIALFSVLMLYFFWEKHAVVGGLLMILVTGMIERVIHTTYTFRKMPLGEKEYETLVISKGRFSSAKSIPLHEITEITAMRSAFGLSRYLLLVHGPGKMTTVMPTEDVSFLAELKRRREEEAK